MAGGGRAPWASHDDYLAFSLIILALAACVGSYLIWHFYHELISLNFAISADWQIKRLQLLTHRLDVIDQQIQYADYNQVTLGQIWGVQSAIGAVVSLPSSVLMAFLAVPCFLLAAPSRFTGKLDLSGLIRVQARHFPALTAFADRELRLVPLDKEVIRPSDPALHPGEWVDRFGRDRSGQFDEVKVRAAFARQLGPLWKGPAQASPATRVLFAAFALHLAGDRARSQGVLASLASSVRDATGEKESGPEKPLTVSTTLRAEVDGLLAQSPAIGAATAIAAQHAYAHTALMSLLTAARRRHGVLPPASFAAVKLIDRPLWYALHSLGFPGDGPGQNIHPNPRIEAAGARSHWAAECLAEAPLVLPAVDAAVDASRAALPQATAGNRKIREVV